MSNWTRSNVFGKQLFRLVEAGQLRPLTEAVEWIVPADESMPRPPSGYVVSFVVFHERYFSVPAGRLIRGVLFAYGLQLQHLNRTTSSRWLLLKQCARGSLGSVRDWYMFQYFFRFTCLRDGSRAATIGCANLQTKQGRVTTTSQ
jgi:hypothetical protein